MSFLCNIDTQFSIFLCRHLTLAVPCEKLKGMVETLESIWQKQSNDVENTLREARQQIRIDDRKNTAKLNDELTTLSSKLQGTFGRHGLNSLMSDINRHARLERENRCQEVDNW